MLIYNDDKQRIYYCPQYVDVTTLLRHYQFMVECGYFHDHWCSRGCGRDHDHDDAYLQHDRDYDDVHVDCPRAHLRSKIERLPNDDVHCHVAFH